MKKSICLISLLLTAALLLSACGGKAEEPVPDAEAEEQLVGSVDTEPEPDFEEPDAPAAVTSGTLIDILDEDWMILDADGVSGWYTVSWAAKGYGCAYAVVNPATGQRIEGEEGAEAVLCRDAIVQFQWRDSAGNVVSSMDVYYYEGTTPVEVTLYAVIYDLNGNLLEERVVLTMMQSADDPYFSVVYPAMTEIVDEFGGGSILGRTEFLTAADENGDAVVRNAAGEELIRLPGVDAKQVFATSVQGGRYVAVCRPDTWQTEIYFFDV